MTRMSGKRGKMPRKGRGRKACLGLAVLVPALLLAAGSALAGEAGWVERWKDSLPFDLTGQVEVGGQVVEQRGNSPTFDEYRDLDSMATVPNVYLRGEDRQRRGYVEMGGTNLNRNDAYYFTNAGRYNYYKFFFEFDRIPHVIAHNAQTIYDEGPEGNFTVRRTAADPSNAALQTALVGAPGTRAAIINQVNARLTPVKLGFQTDAARMGASWLVTPELELGVTYTLTMREGRTPLGTVIGSPGSNVVELSIPRDERYHEMKAAAEFVRDQYQLRFNYTFSAFENFVDAIQWENPCGAGAAACQNTTGLGRYSQPPDNFAHTFSLAGGYNLPWWSTRLTAAGSYAFWRQDDTFLPYTTATTANTTDEGASSPDAKMNVALLNLGLSTRPVRDVSVRLRYRLYDLDDQTPEATFTGVLNPGDLTPATGTEARERRDFRRQNTTADVSWRVLRPLTLRAGYEFENWNRKDREAAHTDEHILKAGADISPWSWLVSRFTYTHGVRTIGAGGYEPLGGNADVLPQMRKFDESDRTRDKGDVLVQVSPLDTLTLSGSFYIQNDGYWNTNFGLWQAQALGVSGDVSWAPLERLALFAGYARDIYRSKQQNCFISVAVDAAGNPAPPPPAGSLPGSFCAQQNIFTVRPKDVLDTVNVGATFTVIPSRLDLSAGYRLAFGKSRYELGSAAGNPASDPGDVPAVQNRFHIVNVVARYMITKNWTAKLGYQYERYEEKDFTTDFSQPALAGVAVGSINNVTTAAADVRSIVLGAKHPNYEAHIVAFSVAFQF